MNALHGCSTTRLSSVLAASLIAALLAACSTPIEEPPVAMWRSADPRENHPIIVGSYPYELDLELPPEGESLSDEQKDATRRFLRRFRAQGKGRIDIATPVEALGSTAQSDLSKLLRAEGIPARAVRVIDGGDPSAHGPAIRLAFTSAYVAQAPECGYWPENLADTRENTPHWNFGCAQQRNLAMMVSDPNDILGPPPMDGRSAERRDVVWKKYVKGEGTGADEPKSEESSTREGAKQ